MHLAFLGERTRCSGTNARFLWGLVAAILCCGTSQASAQTADSQALRQEIDQLRKEFDAIQQQYGERLSALEARLGVAQGAPATGAPATPAPAGPPQQTAEVPPGAAGAGGPTGSLPIYGTASAASKIFNPDIAVIARLPRSGWPE